MRQKSGPVKESAEKVVKDIRRATRRHFSAEDKIRIVLEGLIDVIKCFQERLLCKACLGLFKHFQRWNIFSGKDLGPAVARFSFEKCDGRH